MEFSEDDQTQLAGFENYLNQCSLSAAADANRLLRKAIKQFNQKHYELTYKVTNLIIERYPYLPRAWSLRGELKDILFNDWSGSENECVEAINLNPGNIFSYLKLLSLSKRHSKFVRMLHLMAYINGRINRPLKVRVNKRHHSFTLPQKHLIANSAYNHLIQYIYPEIISNNERMLTYCLTEFIWDRFVAKEIRQLPGKWIYGYGYFLLTDTNAYLVNIGELANKVFTPGRHTFCIFPNEPAAEEIEERTYVRKIRYQDFHFANSNYCKPIIEGKVWDINLLNDHAEEMAFLIAYKSALYGDIDKWFEPINFT